MFELSIVTAEKTIYQGNIVSLVAPAVNGELGVLTGHRALVTRLDVGGLRFVDTEANEKTIFVAGGFLEVNNNRATVLADTAENIEEIGLEQARQARLKAEQSLAGASDAVSAEMFKQELKMMMMRERLAEIAKYKKN